jgi:hypothetical protein
MNAREVFAECARRNLDCISSGQEYALADDMLAALDAAGKAVVDKEPTREMDEAAHDAIAMEIVVVGEGIEIAEGAPARIWRAMLAAAKDSRDA